jgi:hypothetical protein
MSESKTPFDYLAGCSKPGLESFELSRLSQAARLRKEMREIVEEWIEAEVQARLARWLLERRRNQDEALISFPNPCADSSHESHPARQSLVRTRKGPLGICPLRARKAVDSY